MTAAVTLLHGTSLVQGRFFILTAAHGMHSRLLRASSSPEKAATCAAVEEAIMRGVETWKRWTCLLQDSQVVKVLGFSPLLLHEVKVQEKGVAGATI